MMVEDCKIIEMKKMLVQAWAHGHHNMFVVCNPQDYFWVRQTASGFCIVQDEEIEPGDVRIMYSDEITKKEEEKMDDAMIKISMEEYKHLIMVDARVNVLMGMFETDMYVSDKMVARLFQWEVMEDAEKAD